VSVRALESGPRLTVGKEKEARPWRAPLLFVAGFLLLLLGFGLFSRQRRVAAYGVDSGTGSSALQSIQTESRAPETPSTSSVSALENSSAEAPSPSAVTGGSASPTKHAAHTHIGAKPVLQKKGNERYGRFD